MALDFAATYKVLVLGDSVRFAFSSNSLLSNFSVSSRMTNPVNVNYENDLIYVHFFFQFFQECGQNMHSTSLL